MTSVESLGYEDLARCVHGSSDFPDYARYAQTIHRLKLNPCVKLAKLPRNYRNHAKYIARQQKCFDEVLDTIGVADQNHRQHLSHIYFGTKLCRDLRFAESESTGQSSFNSPGHWDFFVSKMDDDPIVVELALLIQTTLWQRGFSCWLSESMQGTSVAAAYEGVKQSTCTIAIVTRGSSGRSYFQDVRCCDELRAARDSGNIIQPVFYTVDKSFVCDLIDTAPKDLKFLGGIEFVELDDSDSDDWDAGIDRIMVAAGFADKPLLPTRFADQPPSPMKRKVVKLPLSKPPVGASKTPTSSKSFVSLPELSSNTWSDYFDLQDPGDGEYGFAPREFVTLHLLYSGEHHYEFSATEVLRHVSNILATKAVNVRVKQSSMNANRLLVESTPCLIVLEVGPGGFRIPTQSIEPGERFQEINLQDEGSKVLRHKTQQFLSMQLNPNFNELDWIDEWEWGGYVAAIQIPLLCAILSTQLFQVGQDEVFRPLGDKRLIRIQGCSNAALNASFWETNERHNGEPLLQNGYDENVWLRCTTEGNWAVSTTANLEANDCYGLGVFQEKDLARLGDRQMWKVAIDAYGVAIWANETVSVEKYYMQELFGVYWEGRLVSPPGETGLSNECIDSLNKLIVKKSKEAAALRARNEHMEKLQLALQGIQNDDLVAPSDGPPNWNDPHRSLDEFDGLSVLSDTGYIYRVNFAGYDIRCPLAHVEFLLQEPLVRLDLSGNCQMTGDLCDVSHLSQTLTTLDLSHCEAIVGSLQSLAGLVNLTQLHVGYTGVSGDLTMLRTMGQLRKLNLAYTLLTGNLQGLEYLGSLINLNLAGCEDVSDDLQYTKDLHELASLNICGCTNITGSFLPLQHLAKLVDVKANDCINLEGTLRPLNNCTALRELQLFNTPISGAEDFRMTHPDCAVQGGGGS